MEDYTKWIDDAWKVLTQKVCESSEFIGVSAPNLSKDGKYLYSPNSFWTKGFWPGILWLIYDGNNREDEHLKELAIGCEDALDKVLEEFYMLHHDNGFVWSLSSVAQYKLTGNLLSRRRALTAASHLAGRFNLKGQFIRAWNVGPENRTDVEGWAIIDCTMNLPLLYWATQETGDPRFKHIAMAHADTVLKYFLREDGSVYHIVCFDAETGEHLGYQAGQGYSETSAWARGLSWALYGLALSYKYTKEQRYLDGAKRAAEFWMQATSNDLVSEWDFKAPEEMQAKDTSASACAACGLLEISGWLAPGEAEPYFNWGRETLIALFNRYGTWHQKEEGLLSGGTFHYKLGQGINCSLIYGDYFFTEGLYRLKGNTQLFW